jgi:TRAP-type C4-dicarboxylate transport system substrate-binding protein
MISLRAGTNDDASRPSGRAIVEFAAQVRSVSGGKLSVEPVWEAAGPEVRNWDQVVARKVVNGELDLGMIPARSWDTEGVTTFQALQAPFVVTSDTLLNRVTKPLLAPEDFAGKTIRTPRSESGYALFRALGAKPDDLTGDAVINALHDGSLAGYDNGYALASNLPAKATATGNLTLYPKANVLVINQKTLDKLPADQQAILANAAMRTQAKMVADRPGDIAEAQKFCADGGTVVLTTAAQLRRFGEIAKPLYADLQRDPAANKLLKEIQALKKEIGAPATATPCGK